MLGFMAKKVGMTQVFDEEGNAVPVTVLEILENVITQKKETKGDDGYNAFQIGTQEETKEYRMSGPEIGHLKKKNLKLFRTLKEFRVSEELLGKYNIGDSLNPSDILGGEGALLDAQAKPKGKGTMGRIKRWSQHRRTMSHGTKHHRQIGSAGAGTTPGRVIKGKKMPGRENLFTTIRHLLLFKCDLENGLLLVRGAVPGANGSLIVLQKSKPKTGWNAYARSVSKK